MRSMVEGAARIWRCPFHHDATRRGPKSGRSLPRSDPGLPGAVQPDFPRSGEDQGVSSPCFFFPAEIRTSPPTRMAMS